MTQPTPEMMERARKLAAWCPSDVQACHGSLPLCFCHERTVFIARDLAEADAAGYERGAKAGYAKGYEAGARGEREYLQKVAAKKAAIIRAFDIAP